MYLRTMLLLSLEQLTHQAQFDRRFPERRSDRCVISCPATPRLRRRSSRGKFVSPGALVQKGAHLLYEAQAPKG